MKNIFFLQLYIMDFIKKNKRLIGILIILSVLVTLGLTLIAIIITILVYVFLIRKKSEDKKTVILESERDKDSDEERRETNANLLNLEIGSEDDTSSQKTDYQNRETVKYDSDLDEDPNEEYQGTESEDDTSSETDDDQGEIFYDAQSQKEIEYDENIRPFSYYDVVKVIEKFNGNKEISDREYGKTFEYIGDEPDVLYPEITIRSKDRVDFVKFREECIFLVNQVNISRIKYCINFILDNMDIVHNSSSGECLYRSFAQALYPNDIEGNRHEEIRNEVCNFMKKRGYIEIPECSNVERFGTELDIKYFSESYKKKVVVLIYMDGQYLLQNGIPEKKLDINDFIDNYKDYIVLYNTYNTHYEYMKPNTK